MMVKRKGKKMNSKELLEIINYADELETEAGMKDFDVDFFLKHYKKYYQEEIEQLEIPMVQFLDDKQKQQFKVTFFRD
jgi:hypothetical protein